MLQETSPMTQSIASLTEQEQRLIARARAGEPVRDEMILSPSLQRAVKSLASRYIRSIHQRMNGAVERDDLVQTANETMLSAFWRALDKDNPYSYLLRAAHLSMINYVNGRHDCIKTFHQHHERIPVLSLDYPMSSNEGEALFLADVLACEVSLPPSTAQAEQAYDRLHRAIERLSKKQRAVIERHYGINDHAPESLNEISRSLSSKRPQGHASNAYYHHKNALTALRKEIAQA